MYKHVPVVWRLNQRYLLRWMPALSGSAALDPYLTDPCQKLRTEFDVQKRIAMAKDIQRYDAKKQYYPRYPGGANTFSLAWPALRNYLVYQGTTPEMLD